MKTGCCLHGLSCLFAVLSALCGTVGCSVLNPGRAAGEEAGGPWWMQQTALTCEGKLTLTDRPWWARAAGLKVGEQFVIADGGAGEAAGRMLVRREMAQRRTGAVEAIVWVIDDDNDGSIAAGGDLDSDCYVVDYSGDGVVDRMVDYIDNDGDHDPDEMDIRYFVDGELRQVWCGDDLDDDSSMWDLAGYEYSANFFRSDPYGDGMIYMNKFDPLRGRWVPISECPFAFYDTDGDGFSEVVVRVSAAPLAYDPSVDPDYANDAHRYQGRWDSAMQRMGIVNIRYSFDVDGLSSADLPLHYDFGFNLVGNEPYDVPGMYRTNAKRRPPQTTCVIPWQRLRAYSDAYPARETGLSWQEHSDDTIAIGDKPRPEDDWRWEGVFWIWERRFMENTGGPNQKWNVRREWSRKPSRTRELYYSGIDGRIHLVGAEEGWIEVGHFSGLGRLGEVRMFDTDGNGFFDRWEVYMGDASLPARVTTVRDEKAERIRFDYAALCRLHNEVHVPAALKADADLSAAMRAVRPFDPPAELQRAMETGSSAYRRYACDIALEMQYQDLRQHLAGVAEETLHKTKMNDLRPLDAGQRAAAGTSQTAWAMARAIERLDAAYGQGEVDEAIAALKSLREMVTKDP